MKSDTTNIIFCGVGGQGVILSAKILLETAFSHGYDVKESEIHGMAQRGGSVECQVRFGKKVYSPLIRRACADYIVSLELLESLRKIEFLRDGGTIIVNNLQIDPAPVSQGLAEYPTDIVAYLGDNVRNCRIIETDAILREIGNQKVINVLMLGCLSKFLEFSELEWLDSIKKTVQEKFIDVNTKAFFAGREWKSISI